MMRTAIAALVALSATVSITWAHGQQLSTDPFPTPIETNRDVIAVNYVEFAVIPNADGGVAPRLMHMITEPGTQRLFVSTMLGVLYGMDYSGQSVTPYIDISAEKWGVHVLPAGSERGLQSFAFHPQFSMTGTPGYGKFYTYTDTSNTSPAADYVSGGERRSHDTVLLEWSARDAHASNYDGGMPVEVFRAAQPFPNHNGGEIAFNPLAASGDEDFGLLYVGLADGGSGGDPLNGAQNKASFFGKILRIDPLGNNSANGRYGIPATNPFADGGSPRTLGEIYAYGVRNPQRFSWDSKDGRMLLADIGQNQVEEISPVVAGGNLGWNAWEGSFRYIERQVDLESPRSDSAMVWPLVEYDHADPLFQRQVAITGLAVYRESVIPQLQNLLIFGDSPSGELFYVNADAPHSGGQDAIRRILLIDGDSNKTLLQLIKEENAEQGRNAATRADLRFGYGPQGQIFVLNKQDGIIRLLVNSR